VRSLGGAIACLAVGARRAVLIVDVSADSLSDPQLLEGAKAISLLAWDRLGR
jgi:hypothetical protein